jgi:hypothetical protein
MLALFEVLSLEGWLEVRDVIIQRVGAVSTLTVVLINGQMMINRSLSHIQKLLVAHVVRHERL